MTDNKQEPADVALIRIMYQDADSGESTEVTLDPVVFVGLVHVTRTLGREHALAVLRFGATLVKPALTTVDTRRLDYVLTALDRYIAQWDDLADLALALSYAQRRDHQVTDAQAAPFATALLDQAVSTAAWRQRVDQWAAAHRSSGTWTTSSRDARERGLGPLRRASFRWSCTAAGATGGRARARTPERCDVRATTAGQHSAAA